MAQDVDNPLFARVFHRFFGRDRGRGEADLRRELLGRSGRVVEVGAGNGINFEHYPASVDELIAVEPEPYLRGQAERAAADARIPVRVMPGTAGRARPRAGVGRRGGRQRGAVLGSRPG